MAARKKGKTLGTCAERTIQCESPIRPLALPLGHSRKFQGNIHFSVSLACHHTSQELDVGELAFYLSHSMNENATDMLPLVFASFYINAWRCL